MSKPKLSNADFCRAAKRLKCEVAAIKAVANTESAGNGFYADDFPVILYERHLFRKFTQGRYNQTYPELSGPQGGYGPAGANQRHKFNMAFAINPDAAMKACSWGEFQILGSNHQICGYSTAGAFVDAMKEGSGKQLDAFVSFVIGNHLDGHLRNLNWAKFARGYNGPAYAKNRYDTKMATAYARFSKENINCSKTSAAASIPGTVSGASGLSSGNIPDDPTEPPSDKQAVDPPPIVQPQDEVTKTEKTDEGAVVTVTTKNEQDVNVPAQVSGATYQGVGLFGVLKKDFAVVTGGNLSFQGLQEYATQASGWPPWVISILTKLATIAIIAGVGWLVYRLVHYVIWKIGDWQRMKVEAQINSDVTRKNVEWT